MRGLYNVGVVVLLYCLCDVIGQTGTGSEIQMSYSIQTSNSDDNSTTNSSSADNGPRVQGNVGVWRPRQRGSAGQRRPFRIARRLENGRIRPYIRRRPGTNGVATRVHHRRRLGSNSNVRRRAELLRRRQLARRRLVATGTHRVVSSGQQTGNGQSTGVDPFTALEQGQRQQNNNVFRDRQTAYDFLSNGGNSFRVRNENQRERREENARMAAVMCGVFGKQFVPSAIGGRCVDPS